MPRDQRAQGKAAVVYSRIRQDQDARHKDISTTMKHYVRAKEDAKRRAIEGVSLGRIIGEGS
jgi:hypothetical protein